MQNKSVSSPQDYMSPRLCSNVERGVVERASQSRNVAWCRGLKVRFHATDRLIDIRLRFSIHAPDALGVLPPLHNLPRLYISSFCCGAMDLAMRAPRLLDFVGLPWNSQLPRACRDSTERDPIARRRVGVPCFSLDHVCLSFASFP